MRSPLLVGVLAVVAAAVAGCSGQPVAGAPAPTSAPSSAAHKPAAQGLRGQITAETGSTWTVTNAKGRAFTVTVNPQTTFGTAAAPAAAAQFPVGTAVRVTGSRTGTTVTATRITLAKTTGATPPAASTPSAAPTPLATPADLLDT